MFEETEFTKALMVLGPRPRKPEWINSGDGTAEVERQVAAYCAAMDWNDELERYAMRYHPRCWPDFINNFWCWIEAHGRMQ